ncbi:MAG: hypothetical protein JNM80_08675 [Phycisphaerae bacterium]|nr:hypothetical protein [Phycisphaerae bacterium]
MSDHGSMSVLGVLLASGVAGAQPCSQWTPKDAIPGPRYEHAAAYDSARGRLVVFGGYNGQNYYGDTWEWDGSAWMPRFGAPAPTYRVFATMAYDSVRRRVVLFGGLYATGPLSDTWEWDGQTWTPRETAVRPSARFAHAAAYDSARARMVVFGGFTGSNLDDTWAWDGTTWTLLDEGGGPEARQQHRMVYDASRDRLVMFGGQGVTGILADTWEYDGVAWAMRSPLTPPGARAAHAMVYDERRSRVVMFGGVGESYLLDTWEYIPALGPQGAWAWNSITGPTSRAGQAMAYDAARSSVVMVGGWNGTEALAETWALACEPACPANCDASTTTPVLNVADFVCFLNRFAAGDPWANCDGSTALPVLNVNDFVCFLNKFVAGCT